MPVYNRSVTLLARSGAYNHTLTPFGFQAEERTLWQVPDTYIKTSPFMFADKVKDPILLIYGQGDDSSGTFPVQSERFYHALKGNSAMRAWSCFPTRRMATMPASRSCICSGRAGAGSKNM